MSKFYTAVAQYGNNILCKEIVDGKSRIRKIPYQPSLYFRTKEETKFKTMEGEPLKQRKFNSINDAKEYVKTYKDVENNEFFGNTNWIYQFICDEYPEMDFDLSQLGIWTLDVETEVSSGFPHPAEAAERLQLITMLNNQTKKYITWGLKPFDVTDAMQHKEDFDISAIDFEYRYFKEESDMLSDLIFWWKNAQIDCLTDWNGESFDIPYIVNRINRVLGEDMTNQLSPFRIVKDRTIAQGDREFITYDLLGIAHLDYLQLYKKFTYTTRESYKLDHIGDVELGIKKIDMGCTFKESYNDENWLKFVLYNLRDCEIVDKLEDKLGLIQLAYTVAYDAKCLPNDVFGAVKTWDCMMYRFMFEKNIIVPQKKSVKSWNIAGAYVKEPVPGQYKWIASFDAASLYPTIIMQYNMSPETLVDEPMRKVTVNGLLEKEYDLSDLSEKNYGMTANGQYFRNAVDGLFPEIVAKQFADRKMYKKLMQKSEAELELVKAEMKKRGIK
jgi:DNA polymerase elongation subunit (family B)